MWARGELGEGCRGEIAMRQEGFFSFSVELSAQNICISKIQEDL